jgi:hypothetical protein
MAFSIDHKTANNLSDMGAVSRTISSARAKSLPIAHAAANILLD